MSAWLCGNRTLSLVVDVIKSEEFQVYDEQDYTNKSRLDLINILTSLNTKSLDCRYGFSKEHILENKEYTPSNVSDFQKYKSVCCYLYQTCECLENEEHPLFQALDAWSDDKMEEYDELEYTEEYEWDIDNPRKRGGLFL